MQAFGRRAGQRKRDRAPPGGREQAGDRRPHQFGAMGIGNDEAGLGRREGGSLEERRERFRHRPEEGVAVLPIVRPLAVSQEIAARELDLGQPHKAAGIDADEVGAAAIGKCHLANRREAV